MYHVFVGGSLLKDGGTDSWLRGNEDEAERHADNLLRVYKETLDKQKIQYKGV